MVGAVVSVVLGGVLLLVWLVWYVIYRLGWKRVDDSTDRIMSMISTGRAFAMDGNLLVGPNSPPVWLFLLAIVALVTAIALGLVAGVISLPS